eukprot:TRINITY_DN15196_c0_g1_i1.p1 TRINITY_DN15196_c0_g1~~TRINITY_DN15196_c0_g1_i1.p1  ORF type:complete len:407 (-),score=65.18 TRINITY_DN15196_c0_g1_i1:114-1334(-)
MEPLRCRRRANSARGCSGVSSASFVESARPARVAESQPLGAGVGDMSGGALFTTRRARPKASPSVMSGTRVVSGGTCHAPGNDCPSCRMHWSQPERDGRTPVFCSVCGSRSQSRRRVIGDAAVLRYSVDLLREIVRRQEDDIAFKAAECKRLGEDLDRRKKAAADGAAEKRREKEELDAQILAERVRVDRLRREVEVWRRDGDGHAVHSAGYGSACSSSRGAPAYSGRGRGGADVAIDEAQHEADRRAWQAQKLRLECDLEDLKVRCQRLSEETSSQRYAGHTSYAWARTDTTRLMDELAHERRDALAAQEKVAAAERELEEERRRELEDDRRIQADVELHAEERTLMERRLQAEEELHRAQQVQLQSVRDASEALKSQIQRAKRENSELRVSLDQSQETLRQLRQ